MIFHTSVTKGSQIKKREPTAYHYKDHTRSFHYPEKKLYKSHEMKRKLRGAMNIEYFATEGSSASSTVQRCFNNPNPRKEFFGLALH